MDFNVLKSKIEKFKWNKEDKNSVLLSKNFGTLSDDQMEELCDIIAKKYPKDEYIRDRPKISHMIYALFIRHLFSVLHKNGSLIDLAHPERKNEYKENCNSSLQWERSFKFCEKLESSFKKINSHYGLVILYEMLGHRYGDLALLTDDKKDNIEKMKYYYKSSYECAQKINCVKQFFTPWYWGACYFYKLGMPKEACEWFSKFFDNIKHITTKDSYINKCLLALKLFRKSTSAVEYTNLVKRISKQKSEIVHKLLKRIK